MGESEPEYLRRLRDLLAPYGVAKRVAEASGIPYQTIAHFKGGVTDMSPERVDQVARALGRRIVLADDGSPIESGKKKAK